MNGEIDSPLDNKPTTKRNTFLICGNCFWMVSTVSDSLNKNNIGNWKCPIYAYEPYNFFI